ncbi:nitroreductase family protein [bacterium]|nr:nitroreductase family protein [bacterium]PJA74024.1 MAG: nitroreductase family protein [bacterium CG_4_9_14_3_um_filter_65_15]
MTGPDMIPPPPLPAWTPAQMLSRAEAFRDSMTRRRSVREFSDRAVPWNIIRACLECAGQAPSGANKQPWHFEAVAEADLKRRIRLAAEEEERRFYRDRAPQDWLDDLEPLGTNADKPFLETAPWLIAVFEQRHGKDEQGNKQKHYYTKESVGLATGFLIAALHQAGLATLTHTPSPMGFLGEILDRPAAEKAFLLLVVGHPAEGTLVPNIRRKDPDQYIRLRD